MKLRSDELKTRRVPFAHAQKIRSPDTDRDAAEVVYTHTHVWFVISTGTVQRHKDVYTADLIT